MPTVLLLRHGEITQSSPRCFVGQTDLPLTDTGRAQAAHWRDALRDVPLSAAWCSSLSRCQEMAGLVLAERDIAPMSVDGLREISLGAWEGLSVEEVKQRFPGEYERRGADLANVAPSGGESFAAAQQRAWRTLESIIHPGQAQATGIVLVVAHAGINRALICRALRMPLENLFRLGQDYGALNILDFPDHRPSVLQALNLLPGSPLPARLHTA
jgi:broad specificity phosphatase PhoE